MKHKCSRCGEPKPRRYLVCAGCFEKMPSKVKVSYTLASQAQKAGTLRRWQ